MAGTCILKLVLLPALGLALFRMTGQVPADYVPALILLVRVAFWLKKKYYLGS